jgi:hypothetical protein
MARYLSFELPQEEVYSSPFTDYTLGDSELLPHYFGNMAHVNIFLGENNSGKSRFMREIMKRDPARVFDDSCVEELNRCITDTLENIYATSITELYTIEATAYQAAQEQKSLVEFLSINPESFRAGHIQIKISPKDIITEVAKLLEKINNSINNTSALLNFLSNSDIEKDLGSLQNKVSSLKRASIIYRNLWNDKLHGLYVSMKDVNSLHFAVQNGGLILLAYHNVNELSQKHNLKQFGERASNVLDNLTQGLESVIYLLIPLSGQVALSRKRTYIPTLRTARTMRNASSSADMIKETIVIDYELQNSGISVNTGLQLFTDIDEKKNADLPDREEFEEFQGFLSETFFNGKRVEVVPNRKKRDILVSVDREERALPYLGDGIQAIILLLYPLFIAPRGAWFFIEEPETHLHPGFQRLFIKTIATHEVLLKKELTIFLTTHSNHLLDFALDEAKNINLFTFRKSLAESGKAKYQVQLTAPQDLECLTALGVQNSSVFLSNCTIWVEGVTDRIYLKSYLKAYLAHKRHTYSLLEGLHYSFLEYAGANVSHYTFGAKAQQVTITDEALKDIQALSISNRIMLVADQDSGKETRHKQRSSQQHAGFEYVVLPVREIENLLSPEVIVGALKKLYSKQTGHFVADQLKQSQYKNIYLAKHLQSKFSELPSSFVGDSGTINSGKKRRFAEAAAEVITSWEMLSPDAQELTKRVFHFIIGHNPRLGSN